MNEETINKDEAALLGLTGISGQVIPEQELVTATEQDPHEWTKAQVKDMRERFGDNDQAFADGFNATTHALRIENAGLRRQLTRVIPDHPQGSMQNAINAVRVTSPLLADQIEQAFNAALATERDEVKARQRAIQLGSSVIKELEGKLAAVVEAVEAYNERLNLKGTAYEVKLDGKIKEPKK